MSKAGSFFSIITDNIIVHYNWFFIVIIFLFNITGYP